MFRLHRNKPAAKSGERIDFKFSNFQATQVPKGWDKLFVSVISVGTGKSIAKLSKAIVRNGHCQWTETLSESICVSQDGTSKELEECLFKLVVATGSTRSGILGEVIINMAEYMSSSASVPVSLPLKQCNPGTILKVKIHCLTPRTNLGDGSKDKDAKVRDSSIEHQNIDVKSNGSDSSLPRNVGSSSSKKLSSSPHPGELEIRETSFSTSDTRLSFASAEGSVGRQNVSSRDDLNDDRHKQIGRQNSNISQSSAPRGSYSVEDPPQSNHSSFYGRVNDSGSNPQNHHQESGQSSSLLIGTSSLRNNGSSKNLLEAAEDTIEELHTEAKMWERKARKLMVDVDIMRKEFSDQSKNLANVEMELSAACAERDGLKKEVEQLKSLLEESIVKQTSTENLTLQGVAHKQELENEIKFQQESCTNLALQLKRSQESNIELVSVLQELEDTIEKQKIEIEKISPLQMQLSDMENSIQRNLQENQNLVLQLQKLQESEKSLQVKVQLQEQALEDKNCEIENEKIVNNQKLLDIEEDYKYKISAKEQEIGSLEAKLSKSTKERQSEEMVSANLVREMEVLKGKMEELERDCNELTDENLELLIKLKESKNNSVKGGSSFDFSSMDLEAKSFASSETEVGECKSQAYCLEEELNQNVRGEDQLAAFERSTTVSELFKLLQMAFSQVNKPWFNFSSNASTKSDYDLGNLVNLNSTDMLAQEGRAKSILNFLGELNKLLEARITDSEEVLKQDEVEIRERDKNVEEAQKKPEAYNFKENNLSISIQELESSKMELELEITNLGKVLTEKISEIAKLEANFLLKDEEIRVLRQCRKELESQVSNLQKEKFLLEENMNIVLRESNISSKCLDDLRNDLMVLSSSVNSHVSANKILESKSSELKGGKHELELHISKLEQENTRLSQHISGLETQLRYLTEERESCQQELENSKFDALSLQNEIRRLGIEIDAQQLDLKQKLPDMQRQLLEAREECEYLKQSNPKLLATAESLIEECSSLEKLNGELSKQKMELHEYCMHLEAELRESQKGLTDYSKRVEDLESKLSSMLEDIASKENRLSSELDALLQGNREHENKLILGENLLNQMYLEKTLEVENLQREVEHLSKQISVIHDARERVASEAVHEINGLRDDKIKLESALHELQSIHKMTENQLYIIQKESERKVEGLMDELSAYAQKLEMMMADHEKMLKLLEKYKLSEEKYKTIRNGFEVKLKDSEFERQQLVEEIANLKVQLQNLEHLRDEVLVFKSKLSATNFEKEKLEASLHLISNECGELKAEKIAFLEMISPLQSTVSELEDCKQNMIALEEKVLHMEADRTARETFCAQDVDLKNELSKIKRANRQFQQKVQQLEEEKDECWKRVQALQEELKFFKEENPGQSEAGGKKISNISKADAKATSFHEDSKISKTSNDMVKSNSQHRDSRRKPSVKTSRTRELPKDLQKPHRSQNHREGNIECDHNDGSPHAVRVNLVSKIQLLENELAEALEANNKYKIQLNSLLSEGGSGRADVPKKSMVEGEVITIERFERTKSSLEAELRDIRERYFDMSLKYAEVEAQREELVMKLKGTKSGKRWFL